MHQDAWREQGNYVDKGPFPQPATEVKLQELERDDDTGEVRLRLTPVNADQTHYEVGADATEASAKLQGRELTTADMHLSFIALDSKGEHETGDPLTWHNRITLKSRVFTDGAQRKVELRAAPSADIRYTTDGSDPKTGGGSYQEPFAVTKAVSLVLAIGDKAGITSEQHQR